MSASYQPVSWNRNKLIYDGILVIGIATYLFVFLRLGPWLDASAAALDPEVLRMRAFGSCAFVLLSIILLIGPLARLDDRFLLLLYNRRHFGVMTAAIALTHASYVIDWYFNYSPTPKYLALFSANTTWWSVRGFPFEWLGVFGLAVLVVMALTSHDFWLSFLTPRIWKWLHMLVYAAYAAIVLHIALGALQDRHSGFLILLVGLSVASLAFLHVMAAQAETRKDSRAAAESSGLVPVGDVRHLREGRAMVVATPRGERIAVFRRDDTLFALSNVCAHQNGPLGEGRIVGGLVTCPWHGFQYRLEDGCAPPPFTERIPTYAVHLVGPDIFVDPRPQPLGFKSEPLPIPASFIASTPVAPSEEALA